MKFITKPTLACSSFANVKKSDQIKSNLDKTLSFFCPLEIFMDTPVPNHAEQIALPNEEDAHFFCATTYFRIQWAARCGLLFIVNQPLQMAFNKKYLHVDQQHPPAA
jgi:hypothetical protein